MTKRITLLNSLIFLIILLWLGSCESTNNNDVDLNFKTYHHTEKIYLFNNENYPSFNLDLSYTTTTDSITHATLYKLMSATYFDSLTMYGQPKAPKLQLLSDLLIKEYRLLERDLVVDSADIGSSFNWEIIKNNEVIYQSNEYISFVNKIYAYTGGAHGNKLENYYTFSLQNKQLINATDFFKKNSCDKIIELQKAVLLADRKDLDEFYVDGFSCLSNFYITKDGVVFHYNQYDIASYAAGYFNILIKTKDINPYINKPFILKERTE